MLLGAAPWYYGIGLAVWGIAVVSTVDNLVRSFFISQGTNLPILLAFFGGIGGIAAFGMVGLFVGPIVLALAHSVWIRHVNQSPNHAGGI
jgi:predicted PurR-regulated permease PerM